MLSPRHIPQYAVTIIAFLVVRKMVEKRLLYLSLVAHFWTPSQPRPWRDKLSETWRQALQAFTARAIERI